MKLVIKSLNYNSVNRPIQGPLDVASVDIASYLSFFRGEQSSITAEVDIDSQAQLISNYLDFLTNQLKVSVTKEILNEYLIPDNFQGDLDVIIQSKKIEISTIAQSNDESIIKDKYASFTQGLSPEEKSSFDKLVDIMLKIKKIQSEVDSYQNQKSNKEDMANKLKEKESEKLALEQKLQSVASLIEHKKNVELEIEKHKSTLGSTPDISEIKETRIEALNQKLISGFSVSKRDQFSEEDKPQFKIKYPLLSIFLLCQLLLSFVYFLLARNSGILFQSIGVTFVLVLIFAAIQITSKEKINKSEQPVLTGNDLQQGVQINQSDSVQDKLIMEKAYYNALVEEKSSLEESIKTSLDNEPYEVFQNRLEALKKEYADLDSQVNGNSQTTLSVDDYYKKRRELDILKIEKDNLEFSANITVKPDEEYIKMLSGEVTNNTNSASSILQLPIILVSKDRKFDEIAEKYNNIRQVIVLYEVT